MTMRPILLSACVALWGGAALAAPAPQAAPQAQAGPQAQAAPRAPAPDRSPAKPRRQGRSDAPAFDLTGVWWAVQPEGAAGFKPDPPLTADAQKVVDEVNRLRASGLNARDKTGNCGPPGLPLIMTRVYPIQIYQQPKMITIVYEYQNAVRWIWTDGRDHPPGDDLIPTYYGHSIGWWEGDTLVVDTVGMDTAPDIQPGVPHTEKLHIVERIKLTPEGFVTNMTLTDPNIFTKPWETAKRYRRAPEAELAEFVCLQEDNNFRVDEQGILRAIDPSQAKPAQ